MLRRSLSMFGESIRMSWSNITGSKMRSFLTILGVIIGVMAIITLITVVQGATREIAAQFVSLGTGKLTVSAPGTGLKRGLNEHDLQELAAIPNVSAISPSVSFRTNVAAASARAEQVTVEGRNERYFWQDPEFVARGRELNILDMQARNTVCLIDQTLIDKLFFAEDPLGQTVYVKGMAYTVVGIISDASESDLMTQSRGRSRRGRLVIPYTSAMRMTATGLITSLELLIDDTDATQQVIEDAERVLGEIFNYKDNSYSIINMESLQETMDTMIGLMTSLLAGIASIALLVGGIGIMNMMLVSVSERTTEIGLRKALGAEPGQIQLQFLIESFMLSILGGILGMLTGLGLSMAACAIMGIAFHFYPSAVVLAVGFSAAVGIIFGWAPARKASNLNPIDALRSM